MLPEALCRFTPPLAGTLVLRTLSKSNRQLSKPRIVGFRYQDHRFRAAISLTSRFGQVCHLPPVKAWLDSNTHVLIQESGNIFLGNYYGICRRRESIKHIALYIKLERCTEDTAWMEESVQKTRDKNDSMFTDAIWRLWKVLSTWKKRRHVSGKQRRTIDARTTCRTSN